MASLTTIRVVKDKNYTTMSNYHLRDITLSCKAKGIMSLMLSLPPTWDFSINGLVSCVKESRGGVMVMLKELEEHGYLVREQLRNAKKRFTGYSYTLYETPLNQKNVVKFPCPEKPYPENCRQINTDINKYLNINNNCGAGSTMDIKKVIDKLNELTGSHYKASTKGTVKHLRARAESGYTTDDALKVVENMYRAWKGTKLEPYIQPSTLFSSDEKFEKYLNWREPGKTEAQPTAGTNAWSWME